MLATELVQLQAKVILAGGGEVGALAAKAATSTIPILIIASSDPVKSGLVASFNRPGGNVTGADRYFNTRNKKVRLVVLNGPQRSRYRYVRQSELPAARC